MIDTDELKQLLESSTELNKDVELLPEDEKNTIMGIFQEPLVSVSKAASKILRKPCTLGETSIDIAKASLLKETLGADYRLFDVKYRSGVSTLAFDNNSIKKMAGILLETVPEEGELTETEVNAFGEVLTQMTDALSNALEKVTDAKVALECSLEETAISTSDENVIQLSIPFSVEEEIDTTIYYYITYDVYNTLFKVLKDKLSQKGTKEANNSPAKEKKEEKEELEESSATVQPICFEELTEDLVANQKENMNLLMDLQLQVSVELGKVKKPIKDILQFTQGTIVELDRLAGENVDILVSGKIIAKGEVVVVDQNFGVRITKIVLPEKRV